MKPPIQKPISCTALVRKPGPDFVRALSTHPQKKSIDWQRACRQHEKYVEVLKALGVHIEELPTLENHPDCPFVEDTALILKEDALICSAKETSRQGEIDSVIQALKKYRRIKFFSPSATLDGGDVLDTGNTLFVGQSSRTDRRCLNTLQQVSGKSVVAVQVHAGLHLKSSVSYLGDNNLLLAPFRLESELFKNFNRIDVRQEEAYGANCLTLAKTVLMASGFSRLAKRIGSLGYDVVELDMSEFEKADGAITCLSLIVMHQTPA